MTGVLKVDDIQDAGANSIVSSNGSGTLTFGSFSAPNITASTAILPDASDGAAIGSASLEFSDLFLADGAVINLGNDQDVTLTHVADTGITLNSTNKLMFNDASQFIQGTSATVLSIGATDEIDLTATAVDLNGTLNVSGVATFQATPVFPDGSLALADLDIDGGTDIGADLADADLFIVDDGAGGTNRKLAASRIKTYAGFTATTITGTTALAEKPAVTDEFILSDAGTLKRIDYEHLAMTPVFRVTLSGAQTINDDAITKITYDTEHTDSNGKFASNKFTPTIAGKYLLIHQVFCNKGSDSTINSMSAYIYKNGSSAGYSQTNYAGNPVRASNKTHTLIVDADADDYFEAYAHCNTTSGTVNVSSGDLSSFLGFRITGV